MAIATINSIDFNSKRGKYTGTLLSVTAESGQKKDHFVFSNAPFHNVLAQCKAGDTVELKMKKEGQYWNLADVAKVSAGADNPDKKAYVPAAAGAPKAGGSGWQPRFADSEEWTKKVNLSISRQSSAKTAVELVNAMLQAGAFKKSATPDFIMQQVMKYAKSFEYYVTNREVDTALASSVEDLEAGYDDDDDNEFPE